MTRILSWNIQNGKGVDDQVSLQRIADVIGSMGGADVLCLQEVSRGLDLGFDAGAPDQLEELRTLFPSFETVFGAAIDALDSGEEKRWQFGNVLLTRLPLLSVVTHPLPRPAAGGIRHMCRVATEAVVEAASGPLRVVNLHLEYHSAIQRTAQVERLRVLQREAIDEANNPPKTESSGPYQSIVRPIDAVYCGDYNMEVDSTEYRRLLQPLEKGERLFADAWRIAHPGREHEATCGVHDQVQWPEGPHCRDFFFVAGRCTRSVTDVRVDIHTDASDHQPMVIELSI